MLLAPWLTMTAVLIAGAQGLRLFLTEDPLCRLRQVRLLEERDGRVRPVAEERLLGAVAKAAGMTAQPALARLDLHRIKSRLGAEHPDLERIVVRRAWPDTLTVLFRKRIPVAQIAAGRYYWVDGQGVLLPTVLNEPDPAFPVIVGAAPEVATAKPGRRLSAAMLDRALAVIVEFDRCRPLRPFRLARIQAQDERSFAIVLDNGVEIRLGPASLTSKAKALGAVLAQWSKDPQALPKYIDLRFEQVIIGPR